jgi:hypothetical protein
MLVRIFLVLLIALASLGVRAAPLMLHDLAVLPDEAGTLTGLFSLCFTIFESPY